MIADFMNPIFVVLHKTSVLNPYTITQPKRRELMNRSILNIRDIAPPTIRMKQMKNIESIDRNIECFIFKLIPWSAFTPY